MAERPGGHGWIAPRYTTSLDAALTLVPDDLMLRISRGRKPGPWLVDLEREDGPTVLWVSCAIAQTGPLAVCIAALKAKSS